MVPSTLRFVVIVAFVVAGAVLIAQFPDSPTSAPPSGSVTPTETTSPTPTGGGQHNNGGGQESPSPPPLEGVGVAVYNGTTQTGLAADVAAKLVNKFHVKVNSTWILNAPSVPVDLTTIYYVSSPDKPAAQALASSSFFTKQIPEGPKVERLPDNATVPTGVQVAVYLGTDYVNAG